MMSHNNHYVITVFFKAKPGKEKIFKDFLTSIIEVALESQGCLKHDLYQSTYDPGIFMFYEIWINKNAHEQHIARREVIEWRAKLIDFLEKSYEVSVWKKIK